jgi:hypothetical protein
LLQLLDDLEPEHVSIQVQGRLVVIEDERETELSSL